MEKEFMSSKLKFNDGVRKVINPAMGVPMGDYLDVTGIVEEVVMCHECHKPHSNKDGEGIRFLTIIGNVHANNGGGLLGSGDWDKNGVNAHHFCPNCLIEVVEKWARKR